MKNNISDHIVWKYKAVYKLCVLRYIAFVKSAEHQAKFFKALIAYCDRLVQDTKNSHVQKLSLLRQYEFNTERVQQDFFRDSNKVLWRKRFVDVAYLLGYDELAIGKISDGVANPVFMDNNRVLKKDELWSFLSEIEKIIRKYDDFSVMTEMMLRLFQRYNLPFIENL